MKISNITGVYYLQPYKNSILKQKENNCKQQTASIPLSNIYLGRDLVSFGQRPFKETLEDNYFQLPKGCSPDEFQMKAGKGLNDGKSVLIEAPTGTGKTAIAYYAASKNLEEGKKTFYTTPLKALSNQKLNEFRSLYGEDKVGILTGDRRENVNAPILIMTTEVYRNMAVSNTLGEKNPLMENLGTVIFDEFHYIGDASRGKIWEDSVIYTPKDVQTLELSATIGNAEELKNWLNTIDNNTDLVSVPSNARHVPLIFDSVVTKSYQKEDSRIQKKLAKKGNYDYSDEPNYLSKPDLSDFKEVIKHLNKEKQLPAIFFIFSRKYSRELLDYFAKENKSLTTDEEKLQIKDILEKRKNEKYLGDDLNEDALLDGYAIHNAGIIPSQKELIEELFQKKLLKVVIATETLASGINMPAKTVVISSPYKPCDENELNMRLMTANEFKQMAGRAGRRGIDTIGYVYTMPSNKISEMDFLELENMECNPIESRYEPDYEFLCKFYENNSNPDELKTFFQKSFFSFNENETQSQLNIQKLIQDSKIKTDILVKNGFLKEQDYNYSLTDKGYLASKVNGYNSIPLVNLIYDGSLDKITPEALALIAGALTNPIKTNKQEIDFDKNYTTIIGNIESNIENVREQLEKSVYTKFRMLHKSMNAFESYDKMLEFAQNIEKPNLDLNGLNEHINELNDKYDKIKIIQEKNIELSIEETVKLLANGKTISTKVLQDNLEILENYKSRIRKNYISSYIDELEMELKELSTNIKGKKAKEKITKRQQEIKSDISKAKTMKYLDDNIYNAINSNYKFIKKNPPENILKELKNAQMQFIKLISKDKLIEEIEGLKRINDFITKYNLMEIEAENSLQSVNCLNKITNDTVTLKKEEISLDLQSKSYDKPGKTAAQIAYKWALMNDINSASMANWKELLQSTSIYAADEGGIYRVILQTADLLSQISEVAKAGIEIAKNEEQFNYYTELKSTADYTRELMLREPIET